MQKETAIAEKKELPEELENPADVTMSQVNIENLQSLAFDRLNGKMVYYHTDSNKFISKTGTLLETAGDSKTGSATEELFNNKEKTSADLDPVNDLIILSKEYLYLPEDNHHTLLAVYTALTYCSRLFNRIPYLHVTGEKNSGKTTLLEFMKAVVHQPRLFSAMTPATIFRIIDLHRPTLIIDEAEGLLTKGNSNLPIFQILNSGYQKDGCVPRIEGRIVKEFSTFCPKIIAGIDNLHETTKDRCITLEMLRPPVNEASKIKKFFGMDSRMLDITINILSCISERQDLFMELLNDPAKLHMNGELLNREFDKWFPLLALAKIFSSKERDYFHELQTLALEIIAAKTDAESQQPKNICNDLIREFLKDYGEKSLIKDDSNFLYFNCDLIRAYIQRFDTFNFYRNKGDLTKTLKEIGIVTDRRRIKTGTRSILTSLYKIPKAFATE